jgi:hypothetical protein
MKQMDEINEKKPRIIVADDEKSTRRYADIQLPSPYSNPNPMQVSIKLREDVK